MKIFLLMGLCLAGSLIGFIAGSYFGGNLGCFMLGDLQGYESCGLYGALLFAMIFFLIGLFFLRRKSL